MHTMASFSGGRAVSDTQPPGTIIIIIIIIIMPLGHKRRSHLVSCAVARRADLDWAWMPLSRPTLAEGLLLRRRG
eukprot:COSAG01_NODE_2755_length_7137_cov_3.530548_6_plen_75_part_00